MKSTNKRLLLRNILCPFISLKWYKDRRFLPLSEEHKPLYTLLHCYYFSTLFSFPNIISPTSYNHKIQWLKLFDQSKLHVICSDKLLVREFVSQKIGDTYLNHIYQIAEDVKHIRFEELPRSVVMKTNHDSGSVYIIRDLTKCNINELTKRLDSSLNNIYGLEKGEWPYSFIKPKVFAEKLIQYDSFHSPPDFKFHCTKGNVSFIQYIFDRGSNTKEVILNPNWEPINLKFDLAFRHPKIIPPKPNTLDEMLYVSKQLSSHFKYARIDLYSVNSGVIFGEMTFFPRAGCYPGKDARKMGALINFDITSYKPLYQKTNT